MVGYLICLFFKDRFFSIAQYNRCFRNLNSCHRQWWTTVSKTYMFHCQWWTTVSKTYMFHCQWGTTVSKTYIFSLPMGDHCFKNIHFSIANGGPLFQKPIFFHCQWGTTVSKTYIFFIANGGPLFQKHTFLHCQWQTIVSKIVREYDQEMPQIQAADNIFSVPMADNWCKNYPFFIAYGGPLFQKPRNTVRQIKLLL